jgi:hypothetical protein
MTSIYDAFETDPTTEVDGITYDMGNLGKFILARAGGANVKFAKAVERKTRPYRQQIERGTIDNELGNSLLIEAFAEGVLLGWKGVKGKDGKDLKFSGPAAIKLLTDLPELFTELRDVASDMANYRAKQIEDDTGN